MLNLLLDKGHFITASDMHLDDEEMDMFNSIGLELDPQFESYKGALVNKCNTQIRRIPDPDEYYDIVHEQVNSIIYNSQHSGEGRVQSGALLWNLISIAFSDSMKANKINTSANEAVESARQELERQCEQVFYDLQKLGEEKLYVLQNSVRAIWTGLNKLRMLTFVRHPDLKK